MSSSAGYLVRGRDAPGSMDPLQTLPLNQAFPTMAQAGLHNWKVAPTRLIVHTCGPASGQSCRRNPESQEENTQVWASRGRAEDSSLGRRSLSWPCCAALQWSCTTITSEASPSPTPSPGSQGPSPSPLPPSPGAGRPLRSSGRRTRQNLRLHRTVRRRPSRS